MSKEKTEIYLEGLPRKQGVGANNKKIVFDLKKCVGHKVKGVYKGKEFEIKIVDYIIKNRRRMYFIVEYKNEKFQILTDNFIKCCIGKILGEKTNEFKIKVGQTFKDNKGGLTIIGRKNIKDKNGRWWKVYKYKCSNPKCGFDCGEHWSVRNKEYKKELWTKESHLLNGGGCSCCEGNQIVVEGINDIATTNPELIKYFKYHEDVKTHTKCSNDEVELVCIDCGKVKKMKICDLYKQQGINCPICSDGISYPNKFMGALLSELNIDFIPELTKTTFKWCEDYRYDFYIPSMNLIIEMDGAYHNKDNTRSGQTKEESKCIDDMKDKLAIKNGKEVIRIDCDYKNIETRFEYIKSNIISKLNNNLDLCKINWIKIGKRCEKNSVKEACNYKKNNHRMTTTEIGKRIGANYNTVSRYLKLGTKLGWCNYNPKEEIKKNAIKAVESIRKPVKIFKDGIELGEYPSVTKMINCLDNDFGIKLDSSNISSVCSGKRKSHKGFTFKYIEENESNSQELSQAS